MKKVLLVTYHFPPDPAVGAVRPAKFAKYLREVGWEPIVLTVKEKYYDGLDKSLLSDANGMLPMVIRTGMLRNPSFYYRKLKRVLRMDQGTLNGKRSLSPKEEENSRIGIRQSISSFLSFPDEQAEWLPFALVSGMKVIRREGIGVLMTSGPPHSVHLIGACLSKISRIPWIADFRDPWSDNCLDQPQDRLELSHRLALRLEAWLVSRAALAITTTERFALRLRSRFPEYQDKIVTIPNGYDPDEFSNIPRRKEKRFTISYVGSIYHNRNPEPVFHVLSELLQENVVDPNRLAIRFLGHCNQAAGKAMNLLISQYGLTGVVEVLPWLPRHQALEMMVRSHVLLLLAEDQPLQVPGKVYDYLGAGSDILAITGDGATADVFRETGAGVVVPPGDQQALKGTIRALYTRYLRSGQDDRDRSSLEDTPPTKYSRRHLTEVLVGHLEKVCYKCSEKRQ
jgi:glycosyltransferase involved in cell wall biosynthesis